MHVSMRSDACANVLSGEAGGWKFIKFHSLDHLLAHIVLFGWIENSSAQAGEHCHKFYLKVLKVITNNHADWPQQIFKIHRREQGLRHLLGELRKQSALDYFIVNWGKLSVYI